jgi:hypothetical protein
LTEKHGRSKAPGVARPAGGDAADVRAARDTGYRAVSLHAAHRRWIRTHTSQD